MSDATHIAMGGGPEFDLIRRLLDTWGTRASGIGDDAAIVDVRDGERLVASTDASVEDVHFKRGWMTPREIGARAATAALSDLAAMGARPLGLLLALGLPESWQREAEALADGVGVTSSAIGCSIIGGNVTRSRELMLTITVLGSAVRPLTRSGARPGDIVFVTGQLGGPGAALEALLANRAPTEAALARFKSPTARIAEGVWLAERGASSMIDISDGLLADASHLATASGVSLSLDVDAVSCLAGTDVRTALSSGEEYELLVSVRGDGAFDAREFERTFGIPLTRIGEVVERLPERIRIAMHDNLGSGHDHLAR